MSTIKADGIQASTGTNTDLTLAGKGTGVPDLAAGFKVGGSAGVPTASIRDDAVTIAKLAAATDGVIITYDASGNPVHVGPGSDGEVLTSTGAGSPPAFEAAAAGGAWTFISKITASTSTTIDFDNVFDGTYDNYVFVCNGIAVSTDGGSGGFLVGTGSTPTYVDSGTDYYAMSILSNTAVGTYAYIRSNGTADGAMLQNIGNASGENFSFTQYVFNPASTSLQTTCIFQGSNAHEGGYLQMVSGAGRYAATTAVTSWRFYLNSVDTFTVGEFRLYGISNS